MRHISFLCTFWNIDWKMCFLGILSIECNIRHDRPTETRQSIAINVLATPGIYYRAVVPNRGAAAIGLNSQSMDSSHSRAILTSIIFALWRELYNNGWTLIRTSNSLLRVLSHKANVVPLPARLIANGSFHDAILELLHSVSCQYNCDL